MLAGLIAAWIAAQAPAASFEVASIKANRSGERIMLFQPLIDRVERLSAN